MKETDEKEVEIVITESDYQQMLDEGAPAEHALKPGAYKGKRGGFLERHPELKDQAVEKVKVTIYLDKDVVDFFTKRASAPDAASCQTQINRALRSLMEQETNPPAPDYTALLDNEQFIEAIVARVVERTTR